MVTKLQGKFVNCRYTLRIFTNLEKLKHNDKCVEKYPEEFCSKGMRVNFVKDSKKDHVVCG